MAQILAVKDQLVNHEFDDIVGIFEDTHKFSDHEKLVFNIYQVKGYDRLGLQSYVDTRSFKKDHIYKAPTTKWTNERPLNDMAWKNTNGKWYFWKKQGLEWSMADLTQQDKDDLANEATLPADRLFILSKIKWIVTRYPENMNEVPQMVEV